MTLIKIYYDDSEELHPLSCLEYSPDFLKALAEMGVITLQQEYISAGELRRVKQLLRLRSMLGVNLTGAAVIMDLLDRIEAMESEINALKRR